MTKLQELIGLVEEASKSKNWAYYADIDTSITTNRVRIRVCRYPMEGQGIDLDTEEVICRLTSIDNQVEMSAICAKMREIIKEENETISQDEIEQLKQRAWKARKEKTC